jgi:hypothetical protein
VGSCTKGGNVACVEFRPFFEDCRASDERVGTGRRDELGSLGINTTVNFEADWAIVDHGADTPDLFDLLINEGLSTEAWVNRHYQNKVNLIEHIAQHVLGRRRTDRYAGLLAQPANRLKRTIQMRTRFRVDRDDVCACPGKGVQIWVNRSIRCTSNTRSL